MSLSVIGVGFGRTGTFSLKLALERLGYDPCYHMADVLDNLEYVALWRKAAQSEQVDWDTLFAVYRSAVDWPACYFWRSLITAYPKAKILLTVRDSQQWYQSILNTIDKALSLPLSSDHAISNLQQMVSDIILERTFEGRLKNKNYAIRIYERHNQEVQQTVEPDRLLVYQVSDGWEPLCRFLERPVPDEPFPHGNKTIDFFRRFLLNIFLSPHRESLSSA